MDLQHLSADQLNALEKQLSDECQAFTAQSIQLDLTRGKPSSDQLALSDPLDGILDNNYLSADGIDTRNYGGLDGLSQARQLGADILGVSSNEVSAQGNSSLSLMFLVMLVAKEFGLRGPDTSWKHSEDLRFICPVPGYDRHFSICEQLGIEMIAAPMTAEGPDMDVVEALVKSDPAIKGMWCVPKYANPTGVVYSDDTVERIAQLGNIAGKHFCVFWDNAYAVHDLNGFKSLKNIMDCCRLAGTEDSVIQFASTSKITHASAGIAFIASSEANLAGFRKVLGTLSIGPDKVNQLRHMRFIPNYGALISHMEKHAALLKPRFDCVNQHLKAAFGDNDLGQWQPVEGGYFISFDTRPGLAKTVVALAADVGVKLTPAGATFPYGKDPKDSNIRIAPSVPSLEQVDKAMEIFVLCVKLASVRQAIRA
ncbi:MAG: aminotransferase class I/II-fold pyridoxal phosphate-dependent enzyme [Pseudomonadota bacterium]